VGRFLVRRGLQAVPVLLGISLIAFIVIQLAPGDPVALLLDMNSATPADVQRVRTQYGLDEAVPQQWWRMMQGMASGELRSIRSREPAIEMAMRALPTTVLLSFWSLAIGMSVGLVLGTVAAIRPRGALDDLLSVIALMGISLPGFWLALILIVVFSENLRWLPAGGIRPLGAPESDLLQGLPYWVMPTAVMASSVAAVFTRYTRSSMLEVLGQDYVRTARGKGLTERMVLARHALRNSLVTVVSLVNVYVPILLSGTIVVETVFGLPGLGRMAVLGAVQSDYPVVMTTTLILTAAVLVSNILADVAYTLVDPRIGLEP
jgi:peptide/nickel transport system permease protein